MLHQLDSGQFRNATSNGDVSSLLATLNPQQADDHVTLLAKIAASLKRADLRTVRSGVIIDEGNQQRAVLNKWENVAANETYEELIAQPTDKRIRILALFARDGATGTTLQFFSKHGADAAVEIGPLIEHGANDGEILPYQPHGWLTLPVNTALGCGTSNHAATGLLILYCLVPNYATDEDGLVLFDEEGNPQTID